MLGYVDVLRGTAAGRRAGGDRRRRRHRLRRGRVPRRTRRHRRPRTSTRWPREWGVGPGDSRARRPAADPQPEPPRAPGLAAAAQARAARQGSGKTTGWVHRATLKAKRRGDARGVNYERIDDDGLHITVDRQSPQTLPVDNVVICAGQEPQRELADELLAAGMAVHVIGGADVAAELDAKRAIAQGTRLASTPSEPDARQLAWSAVRPK